MRSWLAIAALLLPATVAAQEVRLYPQLAGEISLGLYGVSNYRAPERSERYRDLYAKGEFAAGLHLAEGFSVQGVVKFEPLAEGPQGGDRAVDRAFQDQGAFIESLFAEWRPTGRLMLQAGKFTAPFGYGYEAFPGIRLRDIAENYEASESLGVGGSYTFLEDGGGWGEHAVSAALFTLDTTSLSSSFITRKRWGRDEAERYSRNSRGQGGPGNTGRLDNWALALDGDQIGLLPGFSYHLALLSRGAGRDGTAREWGLAIGARQEIQWTEELRTLLFAEAVRFRNSGGRPRIEVSGVETDPATGEEVETTQEAVLHERRTITTLGARTGWGPWRGTIAWQADMRRRNIERVPQESYFEVSVGRELPFGFALDVGWSRTRLAREEGGTGNTDAVLGLLSWRAEF